MLGQPKIDVSLREGGKLGGSLAAPSAFNAGSLQGSREISGRNRTRQSFATIAVAKGKYVADLFAGSGRVSQAIRAAGFNSREWEVLKDAEGDLTRPAVLQSIKFDIEKRHVVAAMLAPPCSSFSVARGRTLVVRDKSHPWGLPGPPSHEQAKVEVGNKCVTSALYVIRWLDEQKPHSPKMWQLPPLVRLLSALNTEEIILDFCCFGTRWRKRTRFLCGNIDLERLRKQCDGTGICSRTRPHVQLTGSHRTGMRMTLIAKPYPHALCHALAHAASANKTLDAFPATAGVCQPIPALIPYSLLCYPAFALCNFKRSFSEQGIQLCRVHLQALPTPNPPPPAPPMKHGKPMTSSGKFSDFAFGSALWARSIRFIHLLTHPLFLTRCITSAGQSSFYASSVHVFHD